MTQDPAATAGKLSDIGWKHLFNSRKWHYFTRDGRSLCGGWMTLGSVGEFGNDDSADNCAKCKKRLSVRQAILEEQDRGE